MIQFVFWLLVRALITLNLTGSAGIRMNILARCKFACSNPLVFGRRDTTEYSNEIISCPHQ